MKDKYVKIITGQGEHVFVLEKDMKGLKDAMTKTPVDPNKIVAQTLEVILHSPEGLMRLSESMFLIREIYRIDDVERLKALRRIIDSQIKAVEHKEFSRKIEADRVVKMELEKFDKLSKKWDKDWHKALKRGK